jgi:hypothetical protein
MMLSFRGAAEQRTRNPDRLAAGITARSVRAKTRAGNGGPDRAASIVPCHQDRRDRPGGDVVDGVNSRTRGFSGDGHGMAFVHHQLVTVLQKVLAVPVLPSKHCSVTM